MKILKATLAISAVGLALALAVATSEAKPPSQVPSGYQAHVSQKKKEADQACAMVHNSQKKPVGGSRDNTRSYHASKHGGGAFLVNH